MARHASCMHVCARGLNRACALAVAWPFANMAVGAGGFVWGPLAGEGTAALSSLALVWVLCSALVLALAHAGARLARSRGTQVATGAGTCQALAIGCLGSMAMEAVAACALFGALRLVQAIVLFAGGAVVVACWRGVGCVTRTPRVRGAAGEARAERLSEDAFVCRRLVLDERTGMLRPSGGDERVHVSVMTLDEYLAQVPGRVVQQVVRTAGMPRHCSCSAIGDATFGNVFIPEQAQVAAGFTTGYDIGFSYYLTSEHLTLVMGEGPARSLMSLYLSDQYLRKDEPASVLYELFDMVIHDASTWLGMSEERLGCLERELAESVREPPRDFNEYVGDTRRKLGTLMRFYKQAGDMFEDLADAGGVHTQTETCQLLRALSNRLHRLSGDAAELRDYVAEIRMGYQERIDVHRNQALALFTVLTTIFASLSLVTGWYGMNFSNMWAPAHEHGYLLVILALIAVVTAEVSYFKRKNWF